MPPTSAPQSLSGSIRLFGVAGISVYLHWSWFLVAIYEFQARSRAYTFQAWNVAEYLALFGIVLLHEFGHAFACRQVGGQANRIVLWPLGGVAYVSPPPRPGALLWSIAAGPLVNVILAPLLIGAMIAAVALGLRKTNPDFTHFLFSLAYINIALLVFNLLPIYPLDGGKILQALLWFVIGQYRSLMVTSVIGLIAGVGILALALISQDVWIALLAAFCALQSWAGFGRARALARWERMPRHTDATCPSCGAHPPASEFWLCAKCRAPFDVFTHRGICPNCGNGQLTTVCPECRQANSIWDWLPPAESPANDEPTGGPMPGETDGAADFER